MNWTAHHLSVGEIVIDRRACDKWWFNDRSKQPVLTKLKQKSAVPRGQSSRKRCHVLFSASVQHRLQSDVKSVTSALSQLCAVKVSPSWGSSNSSIKHRRHWKDRETRTALSSFLNSLRIGVPLWRGTGWSHNLPPACGPCQKAALCAWVTDGAMSGGLCAAVGMCLLGKWRMADGTADYTFTSHKH